MCLQVSSEENIGVQTPSGNVAGYRAGRRAGVLSTLRDIFCSKKYWILKKNNNRTIRYYGRSVNTNKNLAFQKGFEAERKAGVSEFSVGNLLFMNFSQKVPGADGDLGARAGTVSSPAPRQRLEQRAVSLGQLWAGAGCSHAQEGCRGLHRSVAQSSLWA